MIERITSVRDMQKLRDDWDLLTSSFQNPLISFDWFISCAEHLYPENHLNVVTYKDNGKIKAIAPLAAVRRNLLKSYEIMGSSHLYEPAGFIYADETSLQELVKGIVSLKAPLVLNRIHDTRLSGQIRQQMNNKGIYFREINTVSHWIDTGLPHDSILDRMTSRRKYDLRRAKKRADRHGQLHTEFIIPGEDEVASLLKEAYAIESRSWKSRNHSALVQKPRLGAFFNALFKRVSGSKQAFISFLSVDGKRIAMLMGWLYRKVLWILKIGYDEKWSHCSPGILLMHDSIEYAIEHNLERYEFLGSAEKWQHMWPVRTREYQSFIFYPATLTSPAHLAANAFLSLKSKLMNH